MNANDVCPDYTPEQLKKIYAKARKDFTVEMLIEYIEDDVPKIPLDEVLKKADAILFEFA